MDQTRNAGTRASGPQRRAVAERNIETILNAAERLLERHVAVTISAVAVAAGLSRVTVYAHFAARETLLEALVERAVRSASEAMEAAQPDAGPAIDALDRVIKVSWRELERHRATARAAAEQLAPEIQRRTHADAHRQLRRLIERGRREGAFRTDVSADWLVVSCIALMHAAVDEVRADRMSAAVAQRSLLSSVPALWVGAVS